MILVLEFSLFRFNLREVRFHIFNGVTLFDDNLLQVRDEPRNIIKVGAIFIVSSDKLKGRGPLSRGECIQAVPLSF